VSAEFRIDFTSDDDPLACLATFIGLATPVLAQFGYTPEEKSERSAKDWMHWNRGFQNVIRAHAFRHEGRSGVSILGQGEVPEGLEQAVIQRVAESTNWSLAKPF
jgi:hypothetical protein